MSSTKKEAILDNGGKGGQNVNKLKPSTANLAWKLLGEERGQSGMQGRDGRNGRYGTLKTQSLPREIILQTLYTLSKN